MTDKDAQELKLTTIIVGGIVGPLALLIGAIYMGKTSDTLEVWDAVFRYLAAGAVAVAIVLVIRKSREKADDTNSGS